MALTGIGMLAAACGGGPSGSGVASLSSTTTTTTIESVAAPKNMTEAEGDALAYIDCLRTHGEPNTPDPVIRGGHVNINISINAHSGVNPRSAQFAAASGACRHLLPDGDRSNGSTKVITAADQGDYLKAAACMRANGISNFPDPTFAGNGVAFNARTPIHTDTAQYKSALATCQKLIPAGLPYSSSDSP